MQSIQRKIVGHRFRSLSRLPPDISSGAPQRVPCDADGSHSRGTVPESEVAPTSG